MNRSSDRTTRWRRALAVGLAGWLAASPAAAAVPQGIVYQGTLRRAGATVTGTATLVFRLTNEDGSVQYWASGSTVVALSGGLFRYPLGSPNEAAFQSIDWANVVPYVEVTVDGTVLTPRERLQAVPYAIVAAGSAGSVSNPGTAVLTGGASGGSGGVVLRAGSANRLTVTDLGNVGIGTSTPTAKLDVDGDAQFGSGASKSTFTTTGALHIASGEDITLTGGGTVAGLPAPTLGSDAANKSYVDSQVTSGSGWTDAGSVVRLTTLTDNVVIGSTLTIGGDAFSVGASTLVVRDGNVGVGTATPSSRLSVAGDLRITSGSGGRIVFSDGTSIASTATASVSAIGNAGDAVLASDTDANGSGDIVLKAGLSEWARVLNGGNMGIGTASPATKLDVEGAAQFGSGATKSTFTAAGALSLASGAGITLAGGGVITGLPEPVAASEAARKNYVDAQAVTVSGWTRVGPVVRLTTPTDNVVLGSSLTVAGNAFSVGGSSLVVRDGFVGVGADAPLSALQIGSLSSGTGEPTFHGALAIQGAPASSQADGGLEFKHASAGGGSGWKLSSLASANDDFVLASRRGAAAWTDRLTVRGDTGAVGIGAAPTASLLSVGGDIRLTAGSGGRLVFPDGTSLGTVGGAAGVTNDLDAAVLADADSSGSGDVILRTGSSDRLRVANTTGNVGIGTATPATRLEVNGDAQFGSGAAKSTFTATGALSIASGADVTLAGGGKVTGLPTPTLASDAATKAYVDAQVPALSGWTDDGAVVRLTTASDAVVVASTLTVQGAVGIGASGLGNGTLVVRSTSATAANPVLNLQNSAGTEVFRVQQDGSAGLGTSTPMPNDGGSARTLQIGSNLVLQNVAGNQALLGDNAYFDGAWRYATTGAARAVRLGQSGGFAVHIAGSGAAGTAITNWNTTDLRFFISSAGDVGIGTSSPAAKLDVEGNAQFGSGATKSTFTATGALTLAAGADVTLSGGGKVTGLPTPTASSDAATKAYVDAQVPALSGWTDFGTVVAPTTTTDAVVVGSSLTVQGAVGIGASGLGNGTLVVRSTSATAANPVLNLQNNAGTELFRVQQDGNVGIGTSSPVPPDGSARTVQIGSNLILQNVSGSQVLLGDNAYFDGAWRYATAGAARALRLGNQDGVSIHIAGAGAAGAAITNWSTSDVRMMISSAGDVGIGTASPGAKLHVSSGTLLVDGDASTAFRVGASTFVVLGSGLVGIGTTPSFPLDVSLGSSLARLSGSATGGSGLNLVNTDGSSQEWGVYALGTGGTLGPSKGFSIVDRTASDAPRLIIDRSGNVGVGTTAPAATLHVNGFGIVASSLTVGGTAAASGAGATDLTVTGTTFFGTGGSFRVTSSGAATLAASSVGDLTKNGQAMHFGTTAGGTGDKFVFWDGPVNTGSRVFSIKWDGADSRFEAYAHEFTATSPPDLAEMIQAEPDVEAWEVVSVSETPTPLPGPGGERVQVARSRVPYDRRLLGVTSDGSGGFKIQSHMGDSGKDHPGKPLVLAGRVPVKVSLENGPIRIGDPLTSSSKAGVAMRATEAGPSVGIALEGFDGAGGHNEGKVLCFVRVGERNIGEGASAAETVPLRGEAVVGDVVFLGPGGRAQRSSGRAAPFGVVTVDPSGSERKVGVTTRGRAHVRVSLENGPVRSGTVLSAASVPGAASRAVGSGPVLCTAAGEARTEGALVPCLVAPRDWVDPAEWRALRDEIGRMRARLEGGSLSEGGRK